jgi:hypothetical protein
MTSSELNLVVKPIRQDLLSGGYRLVLKTDKTTGEEINEVDFIIMAPTESIKNRINEGIGTLFKWDSNRIANRLGDNSVKLKNSSVFQMVIMVPPTLFTLAKVLGPIYLAMLSASPGVVVYLSVFALFQTVAIVGGSIYSVNAMIINEKVKLLKEKINEDLRIKEPNDDAESCSDSEFYFDAYSSELNSIMNPIIKNLSSKGYEVVLKRDKTTGEEIGELDFIRLKSTSLVIAVTDMVNTLIEKNKDHTVYKLLGDVKVKELKNKAFRVGMATALQTSVGILVLLSVVYLVMLYASPAVTVLLGVSALVVSLICIDVGICGWTMQVMDQNVSLLKQAINEKLKEELNPVSA